VVPEIGSSQIFKHFVLENVMAWKYTCHHTKVLDLKTIHEHGGKAVDFGLCEDCKADEGRRLYALIQEQRSVARNREPIGVEALDPRDFVDAFMQHVQFAENLGLNLPD
jgi:hypothetical protein